MASFIGCAMGASQSTTAAVATRPAARTRNSRSSVAKWSGRRFPSASRAQNRAMAASSQVKTMVWTRVVTENARA